MSTKEFKSMWRLSLVSAMMIAIFWAIYYVVTGNIPTTNIISILNFNDEGFKLIMPFGLEISRLWDIFIGPIEIITIFLGKMIVEIIANETRGSSSEESWPEFFSYIIFGFVMVSFPFFGLTGGIATGILCALAIVLFFSALAGLIIIIRLIFFLLSRPTLKKVYRWLAGE
jgi:hypothetical protein